jgi:hypothetical protein
MKLDKADLERMTLSKQVRALLFVLCYNRGDTRLHRCHSSTRRLPRWLQRPIGADDLRYPRCFPQFRSSIRRSSRVGCSL